MGLTKEAQKVPEWKSNDMDVDGFPSQSLHLSITSDENILTQQMDEEPESIDLGVVDILKLEQACRKKDSDKIP